MASSEEDGTNGASEASDEKEATGRRRRLGFLATAWLTFYNIAMTAGYVRAKVFHAPHALVRSLRGPGTGTRGARARSRGCWGVEPWRRRAHGNGTDAHGGALGGRGGGTRRCWWWWWGLWSESASVSQLGVAAPLAHVERGSACAGPLAIGALGAWPGRREQERACWALGGRGAAGARGAVGEGRSGVEWSEARRGGRPPLAGHCLIRCTVWRGGTGRGPKVKYRPGQECGAARQSPPAVEETVWVCSPEPGAVHWLWAPDPGRVVPGGSLGSVFTYCFFLSMALRNALLELCLKHLEQGRWPASFRPYPLQIPATSKPTPPRPSVSWKFGSYKISLQSAVK